MRTLLIVLLLLNAAYLGWRLWHPAEVPEHRLPPAPPGVPRLALLKEHQPPANSDSGQAATPSPDRPLSAAAQESRRGQRGGA